MNPISKFMILAIACLLPSIAKADEAAIRGALARSMPTVKVDSIQKSQIKGMYEVTVGSNIFYMSDDGKYIIQGKLLDVENRVDLTEEKLAGIRVQAIESLGQDKMIIFNPEKERYTVTVFTDIDCGYCRKLHSEMDQYLAKGISIQYVFFPRAGKGSESYNKAISVWCAKDRNTALTAAKLNQKIETANCDNPVDEHMQLAQDFNVTGTPMIVTEGGTVYPGYIPAEQLDKALQLEASSN